MTSNGTFRGHYVAALKIKAQQQYFRDGKLNQYYKDKLYFHNICTCNINDKHFWRSN